MIGYVKSRAEKKNEKRAKKNNLLVFIFFLKGALKKGRLEGVYIKIPPLKNDFFFFLSKKMLNNYTLHSRYLLT